jgi:hypothetical protein
MIARRQLVRRSGERKEREKKLQAQPHRHTTNRHAHTHSPALQHTMSGTKVRLSKAACSFCRYAERQRQRQRQRERSRERNRERNREREKHTHIHTHTHSLTSVVEHNVRHKRQTVQSGLKLLQVLVVVLLSDRNEFVDCRKRFVVA